MRRIQVKRQRLINTPEEGKNRRQDERKIPRG